MPKAPKKSTARSKRADPPSPRTSNTTKKPAVGRPKKNSGRSTQSNGSTSTTAKAETPLATQATSKLAKSYTSYLLLCRLTSTSNPTITRLLSVPGPTSFAQFHPVLQAAFGWGDCHAHSFKVEEAIQITDAGKFKVPKTLLDIFSELDMELMKDIVGGRNEMVDENKTTIEDIYAPGSKFREGVLEYEYDHGDGWSHQITCLGQADPALRFALGGVEQDVFCVAGEGHECAEDCGGPPGWKDLKELFVKKGKKDPEGRREWYKTFCANGDRRGLDPWKWDLHYVNDALRPFQP